ncbi:hypothetical protein MBLNU457_5311t1 [Dothideomycetes sp. NU457]
MLVLFPILVLAYGVLYAFAAPIPRGMVEMNVRDAILPPVHFPKIGIPISSNSQVASTDYVKRSITDPEAIVAQIANPATSENVGFYHRCRSASPACSDQ